MSAPVAMAASLVLGAAALPGLAMTGYLGVLALASRRRPPPSCEPPPALRFSVVVPAHDEATGIARTITNLRALDWPADLLEILVVADNCTDDTAARAEEAGATVLIRNDDTLQGKGYALAHAFARCVANGRDAVVVVDADTVVSPNLLRAFARRIQRGARAAQADYAVLNVDASWRTRLMAIALGMFHVLRSLGRERLGLSCGLRGNGMCFTRGILEEVPHDAFSIVEDVEYGIRLGLAGHRVHYAEEAHVYGEMVSGEKASRTQRLRWESGRRELVRSQGARLLRAAWRRREPMLVDLVADLVVPPLSTLAIGVVLGCAASALLVSAHARGAIVPGVAWSLAAASLALYVVRGYWLSGTGLRGLIALAHAPFYVAWKLSLRFRRRGRGTSEWIRTTRQGETPRP